MVPPERKKVIRAPLEMHKKYAYNLYVWDYNSYVWDYNLYVWVSLVWEQSKVFLTQIFIRSARKNKKNY